MKEDIAKRVCKIIAHICAFVIFLYALYGFDGYYIQSAFQQQAVLLMQIKYLIISAIIEIGILNGK